MARPKRCRRICKEPVYDSFTPDGALLKEDVILTIDEYETLRLIDLEKMTHEQSARQMDISRTTVTEKGTYFMKIAVTYENGEIFQHFGHTEQFKLYTVESGKITQEQVVSTNGSGHGALAGFLQNANVDTLICGGIGAGAQTALQDAGIKLYGGVSGKADDAVCALLNGTLGYDPDVHCDHHDHEHDGKEHHCGNHGCHGEVK